jgi:predicted outer membrane lipoprotein
MSTRLQIATLVFMMVNAAAFGVGIVSMWVELTAGLTLGVPLACFRVYQRHACRARVRVR